MDECFGALIKICNPNLIHPSSYIKYSNDKLDEPFFFLHEFLFCSMYLLFDGSKEIFLFITLKYNH